MSVVRFVPKHGGQESSESDIVRTYVAEYHVVTNNASDGPNLIRRDIRCPKRGSVYQFAGDVDTTARCTGVDVAQVDQRVWLVTANYSSAFNPLDQAGVLHDNPLDRPPVLSWSTVKRETTKPSDKANKLFDNAVGELLNPPPPIPESLLSLTITRNELGFLPSRFFRYIDSTNADRWFGYPPKRWYVDDISATEEADNGQVFWSVRYTFILGREPWNPLRIPHVGLKYFENAAAILPTLAKDKNGVATGQLVKLRADGQLWDGPKGTTDWLEFKAYDEVAFAPLMLP